jgi:DNA-binding response OmpR family regulator
VDESNLEKCLRFLSEIESKNTAFVILTEDYSKSFELQCLQEGALDLIKKPIHENLLITKIKTIHRNNYYNYLTVDNLFYLNKEYKTISNYENNEVYIGDKAFLILKYLILNDYRRVTRDELIQVIWDEPEHVQPNTLDVHIYRLRAQLEKHFNLRIIDNITNKGYKIINQEISAS